MKTGRPYLSHVLREGSLHFASSASLEEHLQRVARDDIVYEDERTVAYLQHDDDPGSTTRWSRRIVIALRTHVPTLLDLDVASLHDTAALLRAVQAVAFKLKLYEEGFEIRADVMPPLQRKGFLEIKLRSGKKVPEKPDDAATTTP